MEFSVIIPARYAATRLPGKPLRLIAGKPLIQHVFDCAINSGAGRVLIATDDERICNVAQNFGAKVCMTGAQHLSGTDRLAEVVANLGLDNDEIIVNLQGDEPLVPASLIRQVAENLHQHPAASVATLCERMTSAEDVFNPNICKVVMDKQGYAVYFSRAPIPWNRASFPASEPVLAAQARYFRHIGLYAYRAAFLQEFVTWPSCAIEQTESLEQLRVLWNGQKIHVAEAIDKPGPGVDTEADIERVEAEMALRQEKLALSEHH